jgi:tRNA(adenine34) deaminase
MTNPNDSSQKPSSLAQSSSDCGNTLGNSSATIGEATQIDRAMMRLAIEQAQQASDCGEVPIGAVIYRGNEVVSAAHNLREADRDPTAHAEIRALQLAAASGVFASWRMEGCSLAVTLEPCPMCAGALVNSRIERVVYGAPDQKMGAVTTLYEICTDQRLNHRLEVISGVEEDECVNMLRAFFKARRSDNSPPKPNSAERE